MINDLQQLIASMTPELYQRLVRAVELGKWPDGVPLTDDQKAHSLQLVMLWQQRHNTTPEHMTIGSDGEIILKSKQQLKQEFGIANTPPAHPADSPPIATLKPQ